MIYLRYLGYVFRHKWFVFLAGRKTRAPVWALIIHDWSKFLPSECIPYARHFYGEDVKRIAKRMFCRDIEPSDPWLVRIDVWEEHYGRAKAIVRQRTAAFDRAWNDHQKRNRHHWQYWVLLEDNPRGRFVMQSPDEYTNYSIAEYEHGDSLDPKVLWRMELPQLDLNVPRGTSGPDANAENFAHIKGLFRAANRARSLRMPERYAREMVADWMGAGRAINGRWEVAQWYADNRELMMLHPDTRALVEEIIAKIAT